MPVVVKRTGLDEFGSGGSAKLKALIIGGPGSGKTQWASTWDRPIYLDVEGGLASVAHQELPYITVNNSQDMIDALQFLKIESGKPDAQRDYNTVVIDTMDAYQRKLKTEWMVKNSAEIFNGFEAWNFLATKCSVPLVRLLNLDMNVVVNVHYKDKVVQTKDGDNTREVTQFMLQLQGETADTIFNDFDLVGWMDTDYEAVDGKREKTHYLTFTSTPEKPFLKDRLSITPKKMRITLDGDNGYQGLLDALKVKMERIAPTRTVTEIPTHVEGAGPNVASPAGVGGPVIGGQQKTADAADLNSLDKPTLMNIARTENVTQTVDGAPIKGNTIKSELIVAIRAKREQDAEALRQAAQQFEAGQAAAARGEVAPEATTAQDEAPVEPERPDPAEQTLPINEKREQLAQNIADIENRTKTGDAAASSLARQREAQAARIAKAADPATGEVPNGYVGPEGSTAPATPYRENAPSEDVQATKTAEELLGAVAINEDGSDKNPASAPEPQVAEKPAPAAAPPAAAPGRGAPDLSKINCEVCGKNLKDENIDFVKLSKIRYKRFMCKADYQQAKK